MALTVNRKNSTNSSNRSSLAALTLSGSDRGSIGREALAGQRQAATTRSTATI